MLVDMDEFADREHPTKVGCRGPEAVRFPRVISCGDWWERR